jgi:flagellar basal body-associated protein FliL
MNEEAAPKKSKKLFIMILITIAISILSTVISLLIYKLSGDIYIDRSRPGFISEKEKDEPKEPDNAYSFPLEGEITRYDLDDFYEKLSGVTADMYVDAFSPDALSDDVLGITPQPEIPPEDNPLGN